LPLLAEALHLWLSLLVNQTTVAALASLFASKPNCKYGLTMKGLFAYLFDAELDFEPDAELSAGHAAKKEAMQRDDKVEPLDHDHPLLFFLIEKWCRDAELNCGHKDFQSFALPTELPRQTDAKDSAGLN
jgi:hypothetical protein